MLAAYPDHVALAVGDEQDRPFGGEVVGALEQVDAGLQDSPTAPTDLYAPGDVVDGHVPGVVRRRVAVHDPSGRYVPGPRVRRDRAECLAQQLSVHRAG